MNPFSSSFNIHKILNCTLAVKLLELHFFYHKNTNDQLKIQPKSVID